MGDCVKLNKKLTGIIEQLKHTGIVNITTDSNCDDTIYKLKTDFDNLLNQYDKDNQLIIDAYVEKIKQLEAKS